MEWLTEWFTVQWSDETGGPLKEEEADSDDSRWNMTQGGRRGTRRKKNRRGIRVNSFE